jgi:hypothetical protein
VCRVPCVLVSRRPMRRRSVHDHTRTARGSEKSMSVAHVMSARKRCGVGVVPGIWSGWRKKTLGTTVGENKGHLVSRWFSVRFFRFTSAGWRATAKIYYIESY